MKYELHDFYCIKCGRKGIPIQRKAGMKREKLHRKKLYCIFCQQEVNHIECSSYEDKMKFLEDFEKGVYKDEAEESVSVMRSAWIG